MCESFSNYGASPAVVGPEAVVEGDGDQWRILPSVRETLGDVLRLTWYVRN